MDEILFFVWSTIHSLFHCTNFTFGSTFKFQNPQTKANLTWPFGCFLFPSSIKTRLSFPFFLHNCFLFKGSDKRRWRMKERRLISEEPQPTMADMSVTTSLVTSSKSLPSMFLLFSLLVVALTASFGMILFPFFYLWCNILLFSF